MNDNVNHPKHYQTENGVKCIDALESLFGIEGHLFNVIKYVWRAGKKGDRLEYLRKAQWYLARAISYLEKEHQNDND